jgi:hypothetical protein
MKKNQKNLKDAKGAKGTIALTANAPAELTAAKTESQAPAIDAIETTSPDGESETAKVVPMEKPVLSNVFYDFRDIQKTDDGMTFIEYTDYGTRGIKRHVLAALLPVYTVWRDLLQISGQWDTLPNLVKMFSGTDTKITPALIEDANNMKCEMEVKSADKWSFFSLMDYFDQTQRDWLTKALTQYNTDYMNGINWLENFIIADGENYKKGEFYTYATSEQESLICCVLQAVPTGTVTALNQKGEIFCLTKGTKTDHIEMEALGWELLDAFVWDMQMLDAKAEEFFVDKNAKDAKAQARQAEKDKKAQEISEKRAEQLVKEKASLTDIESRIATAKTAEELAGLVKEAKEKVKLRADLGATLKELVEKIQAESVAKFPKAKKATTATTTTTAPLTKKQIDAQAKKDAKATHKANTKPAQATVTSFSAPEDDAIDAETLAELNKNAKKSSGKKK